MVAESNLTQLLYFFDVQYHIQDQQDSGIRRNKHYFQFNYSNYILFCITYIKLFYIKTYIEDIKILLTFTDKMKEFNDSVIVGFMFLIPLRILIVGIHNAGNNFRSLIFLSSKNRDITRNISLCYNII